MICHIINCLTGEVIHNSLGLDEASILADSYRSVGLEIEVVKGHGRVSNHNSPCPNENT